MRAAFTLLLAGVAATTTAAADDDITTILPTEEPTVTIDPWQCLTQNLTEYFIVPRPTGAFLTAIHSHGSELIQECATLTRDSASVWWKSHSSAAFSAAAECPLGWYNAMLSIPGGRTWLNLTRIYAGCHANPQPTSGSGPSKGISMTTGPTAVPGAGATATDLIQPTATPMKNSVLGWAGSRPELLAVAGYISVMLYVL
ncbi:hypothetical protein MGYG_04059 [Nannizzia gypsea CBS 118893]|uniref:DUF7735 domain-containing protein n=1 Tax=Arthroderma gypseum (strain ATCC MYA-4604 / CBS 118893) TaxID=535722 RepID=E4UUT9_ARTGP|nr:hypothetical protein MGYG_04059 [Nannizzia gypsea CBS 118893]EFR01056.1 hypothetical protein MGYG_04059 [Nannizzia gypsea CBS 118893]